MHAIHRTAALSAALLLASVALPPPALADTTVVVHGPDDFPEGTSGTSLGGVAFLGCTTPFDRTSPGGPFLSIRRDDTAPLGERFWQIDAEAGGSGLGPYVVDETAGPTTVATAQVDPVTSTTGVAYAGIVTDVDPNVYWVGYVSQPPLTSGWQTVSSAGIVYHWRQWDWGQQMFVQDGGMNTYAGFMGSHGGSGYAEFAFIYGCDGEPFRTDQWTVGSAGDTTTFDLEGLLTSVSITPDGPKTITAGKTVKLEGNVESGGPLNSQPLTLLAKPYDQPDFTTLAELTNGSDGSPAAKTVKPMHTTAYQWQYAGTDCCEPGTSAVSVISVRTRVTAALEDSTVRKGKRLVLAGRTTPAKPGTQVTLFRRTAGGKKALERGRVKPDGSYDLSTRATSTGAWKLFAVVAAGDGNLAGTSPVRTARVAR